MIILPGNDFIRLILANREYGIFSIVSHSTVWIVPCMVSFEFFVEKTFKKVLIMGTANQNGAVVPMSTNRSSSLKHHFKMEYILYCWWTGYQKLKS